MKISDALSMIGAQATSHPTIRSDRGSLWLQTALGRARIGVGTVEPHTVSARALRAAGMLGEFASEDGRLATIGDDWGAQLLPMDSDPEPEMQIPEAGRQRIANEILAAAREILPFAGTDPSRPALAQVVIEPAPATGKTRIMATNGFMLAIATVPGLALADRALIPSDLVRRVPVRGDCWLTVDADKTWLSSYTFDLCYSTHEDRKIDVSKVIIDRRDDELLSLSMAKHGQWLRAVQCADPNGWRDGHKHIVIDPAGGIISTGSGYGEITSKMTIPKTDGVPKFAVTAKSLLLALRWLGKDVQLQYPAKANTPLRMDCDATDRIVILMPVRM